MIDRVSQMHCMAKYIARSSNSDAVIAVGDFNCKEDETATELFVEASGLTDRSDHVFCVLSGLTDRSDHVFCVLSGLTDRSDHVFCVLSGLTDRSDHVFCVLSGLTDRSDHVLLNTHGCSVISKNTGINVQIFSKVLHFIISHV
jgi:thiamine pyrophosphokinase